MNNEKMKLSLETQFLLSEAEAFLKQGRVPKAAKTLHQVLTIDPEHIGAMSKLALLAFQANELGKCIEILQRAVTITPQDATLHYRLGLAQFASSYHIDALASFHRVAELDPNNAIVRLRLGSLHLAMDDRERAVEAFQCALFLQPMLLTATQDPNVPVNLRTLIRTADQMLKEKYAEMISMTLSHLRQEYPSEDLTRIETSFRFVQGEEEKSYCHKMQRPELLLFPDMQARPWFEREEFDWVPRLEEAYGDIRGELELLLAERAEFKPYIRGASNSGNVTSYSGTDFASLANNHIWDSFHLYKGAVIEENCQQCPKTTEILDTVPLAQASGFMPEVFFSVLRPEGHIIPHYGQMNVRLTVHLGLIVPKRCGMRVGTETRRWEEGRTLAFDDSFEHEAWNRGDSDRAVLIFEVWHPDLTAVEIAGLQKFFEMRGEWMARCNLKPDRHTTVR